MALTPRRVDDDALLGLIPTMTVEPDHRDDVAPSPTAADPADATVDLGPSSATPPDLMAADWPLGATIAGRYEVRSVLGEGGMGTVYRAEQVRPVRRAVALKLIRAGTDARGVLARFEGERQALALMDHPHVARVLDGGTTEVGHPFFVMELVDGLPLTEYSDRHRLRLTDRLRLLQDVCLAVQHAHQKGIIHRDLKPGNILVESRDGRAVPKVIDFGLAKAVDGQPLTDSSLLTVLGAVAGTPLYMAPEQAACAPDVDTRADIYALGVILYELLTGSTPIRRDSLRRMTIDELLRRVREEEPPAPSRRADSSPDLPALAAARLVEPARLGRLLRGELDWVVLRALAKERDRRYDSAAALADDLGRYLRHEPVAAGPPSAIYRARKFARRHRGQVVAATLVLLTLLGGIVGTAWALVLARGEHAVAVAQAKEAERRSDQNQKIGEILAAIFRDLDPRQLNQPNGKVAALIGERLDRAAAQIEGESIGDPLTVARMQMTLAESLASLGYPDKAASLLARCHAALSAQFGPDDPLTLACADKLGMNEADAGRLDRAIPILERALAGRRRALGSGHHDAIDTLGNLAYAHKNAGHHEQAIALFVEALDLVRAHLEPGHPFELICLSNLASCYRTVGRVEEAVRLHERAVPLVRAKFGPDHPDTINAMAGLAAAYQEAGQVDGAIRLLSEALDLIRARLGPDHPETANVQGNLALAYRAAGQADRALPLLEQAFAVQEARVGLAHPDAANLATLLAESYRNRRDYDRASALDRKLAAARRDARDAPPTEAEAVPSATGGPR